MVLPPGTLHARRIVKKRGYTLADVAYEPDSDYDWRTRRRGLAPNWNAHRLPNLFSTMRV